jgi:hypothetical protein
MMTDIRFIRKDGQSVAIALVRKRFFESAAVSGVNPHRASVLWEAAMQGDAHARRVIEEICGIEIVSNNAGFGFLE